MKPKKANHVNVDRKRGLFFRFGLIISISLVIFAFRYTTDTTRIEKQKVIFEPITDDLPPITIIKPPEKPVTTVKIKIIDNNDPEPADSTNMLATEIGLGDSIVIPPLMIDSMEVFIDTTPIIIVEDLPEFPGGESALMAYLADNIEYPDMELQAGIQGLVVVEFVVEKDGRLSNVKVLKGITQNLNKESVRVVKNMPRWKPGKQRKRPVRVQYRLPIRYSIAQ